MPRLQIRELDAIFRRPLVLAFSGKVATTICDAVEVGQKLLPVSKVGLERHGLFLRGRTPAPCQHALRPVEAPPVRLGQDLVHALEHGLFGTAIKACISFFLKPRVCSSMPVRLSHGSTANLWLPKPWTMLASAFPSSSATAVSSSSSSKNSCSLGSRALALPSPLAWSWSDPTSTTTKYRICCFSAKKVYTGHRRHEPPPDLLRRLLLVLPRHVHFPGVVRPDEAAAAEAAREVRIGAQGVYGRARSVG
ncbi:hypothetical protein V501_01448 [Pseudogymnoascus sp. VKM F-4519 (FW-2642)]|nr:hypothetical protein V501_01448 [Pseudogymnoascus sp. VKM F-4519 (FW-2642)]